MAKIVKEQSALQGRISCIGGPFGTTEGLRHRGKYASIDPTSQTLKTFQ